MRPSLFALVFLAGCSTAKKCINDDCQQELQKYGSIASAYCFLYEEIAGFSDLPDFMRSYESESISSACSCITTTSSSSIKSSSKSSSTVKTTSSSACVPTSTTVTSISTVTAAPSTVYSTVQSTVVSLGPTITAYSTILSTVVTLTTLVEIDTQTIVSTVDFTEIDLLTTTLPASTVTAYVTVPTTVIVYSTAISVSTVSVCPSTSSTSSTSSDTLSSTSSSTIITTSSTSSSTNSTPVPCSVTAYSQVAPAVAACTSITLQDIAVPTNSTLTLTGLKAGTVVTFAGTTTFAFTNSSTFNPITVGGAGITIQGAPGHIIDGNGQAYWDGLGSNGGLPKPDHFIVLSKVTANSVIKNLNIRNWPTHCFSISSCSNLLLTDLNLDNTAGNAPNALSNGLAAAHNSDGFDISTSSNVTVTNSFVNNQDDCVAITSGNNMTVSNMWCNGGHGLSIGSVGGKSNNNVTNILFTDSQILNSQNGARIKTNFNTTGFISNITYSNIIVANISIYGIDIQQDYLNGGPTGIPSNGVIIENILISNLTGTATSTGTDYYILCGSGSCTNFEFDNVAVTGGGVASSCNYPTAGCPGP